MGTVRITGVLDGSSGARGRVEVEVQGGAGRLRFAQGPGPLPQSQVGALVVDGAPAVLSLHDGTGGGALVLPLPPADPLPAAPAAAGALDDDSVLALAPLLLELGDGLYTLSLANALPAPAPPGFSAGGLAELAAASTEGSPLVASLGRGVLVLLGGRAAARRGQPVFVVSADVIVDAPGFTPRLHDRGAREAFARSPGGVLDDAAVRDAVAALRARSPEAPLGPFTEDRVEPAAQQARALAWDLRAEDGVDDVSDPVRAKAGAATEFRSRVRVRGVPFDVAFVSRDGRHVAEILVRSGNRFRATGLRPAARAVARTLRQLADEP